MLISEHNLLVTVVKNRHFCDADQEQETTVKPQVKRAGRVRHAQRRCEKAAEVTAAVQVKKPQLEEDRRRASRG